MLHRRDAMMRLGQVGLGGLSLPGLLRAEEALQEPRRFQGSAKSCILLYLWGGPPQIDMWDPKPEAPEGIRSLFAPIATKTPGIFFGEELPRMAQHTDKMAIVRSFTHPSNTHEVGVYHTLAGKIDNTLGGLRNQRSRRDFPNMAGVVSYFTPPGVMPASVTVPRPIGHDGVVYTGTYAGFLGAKHDPLELQSPGEVNGPPAHDLNFPAGLDATRLQARQGLLKTIEAHDRRMQSSGRYASPGFDRFREQAFRMLTSSQAKGAFDVDREPPPLRDRYGRNEWGEAFLLARRLVEAGVRLVTVVWYYICPDGNVANVWDNHGGTGSLGGISGYDMLKQEYCLPSLDRAFSTLLDDLADRGLLDETLVVALGEFGRTPKINQKAGRDHWGACQSIVLAGGGVRGGQAYGASDATAAYPTAHPVRPEDLIATVYHALGLPAESVVPDQQHRPHRISEGRPVLGLFG